MFKLICSCQLQAGYKDADYSLTRAAKVFSAVCALCETLGPLLVLSNDPIIVQCGIVLIFCMHLYIISTLIVDVPASKLWPLDVAPLPELCSKVHRVHPVLVLLRW